MVRERRRVLVVVLPIGTGSHTGLVRPIVFLCDCYRCRPPHLYEIICWLHSTGIAILSLELASIYFTGDQSNVKPMVKVQEGSGLGCNHKKESFADLQRTRIVRRLTDWQAAPLQRRSPNRLRTGRVAIFPLSPDKNCPRMGSRCSGRWGPIRLSRCCPPKSKDA